MTEEKKEIVLEESKISELREFMAPEDLYQVLIRHVKKYHPSDDISVIEKAYKVASEAHKDQKRKSGEPYIIHPLYVAIILADLEMDKETIVAGLLHDVLEDTVMTEEQMTEVFGVEVVQLVDGVTKLENIPLSSGSGTESDARLIIIKLADRLHNMRTLKYQKPESQQRIAKETLEVYSPIAQRLGISKIKIELDDLSL